jgi:hypothetical protein
MPDDARTEMIRLAAYWLWLGEGRPDGRALDHWLRAEQLVKSGLH